MGKISLLKNERGFTLVEIIAVLVLLGILAAVALPKYIDLAETANERIFESAIAELNSRENLAWSNALLKNTGKVVDADVFVATERDLGADFAWVAPPTATGGTLKFKKGKEPTLALRRVVTTGTGGFLQQCPVWSKATP